MKIRQCIPHILIVECEKIARIEIWSGQSNRYSFTSHDIQVKLTTRYLLINSIQIDFIIIWNRFIFFEWRYNGHIMTIGSQSFHQRSSNKIMRWRYGRKYTQNSVRSRNDSVALDHNQYWNQWIFHYYEHSKIYGLRPQRECNKPCGMAQRSTANDTSAKIEVGTYN